MEEDMLRVLDVADEADNEFEKIFGRQYGLIECHLCDDAEVVLVTSGTAAGTSKTVIDKMRNDGKKVGLLKIRLFRPFPSKKIISVLKDKKKLAVIDRNISHGVGGIFAQEIKSAFYNAAYHPPVFGFVGGLGGKDITPEQIEDILDYVFETDHPKKEAYWMEVDV